MIQSQQSRRIQSLIISPPQENCRLTVQKLKEIRNINGQESLEDIMNSVQQISLLTKQMEKKYNDLSYLSSRLNDFVNKSKYVDLFINGDYIIHHKQQILIFSAHRILFCSNKPDHLNHNIYKGMQYKVGKSYYYGQFKIGTNDFLYYDGELFLLISNNLCEKYEGRWSEGSIIEGRKQIFEYRQLNIGIIQKGKALEQYEGEFKSMKYQGKGTLIKRSMLDKGKQAKIEGIFKNGKLEQKIKQQLI